MYKPCFEDFVEKTRHGNLIPVYKEILADLETPVSAYMKIGQGDWSFLLESVEGGEKWARYCFLGCDPSAVLVINGKNASLKTRSGEKNFVIDSENPLSALKELLEPYQPVEVDGLPRFSGGAVGFISYDMVRYFERLSDLTVNDLETPDAVFVVSDTLLIFDNVGQKIKIVSNARVDNENARSAYVEAIRKIESLEDKLRQGLPKNTYLNPTLTKEEKIQIKSSFKKEDFKKAVLKIKNYILEGDVIQTVLAQRLKFELSQNPFDVYRALRTVNPSPYMYYLNFGDIRVVGSSPEALVRVSDGIVETRPIAGTRPRGVGEIEDQAFEKELLEDPKERAEHIMLVDLGRNDLGRVSKIGSVDVNESFTIERYSHVMHIVSNVQGKLESSKDCFDALKAAFPAGTLSGAPKVRAMEIIDELEPVRRGIYGGSIGYFSFNGNMDTAIAIRTLVVKGKNAYLGVGAGIVADSDPEKEFEETMNKGKALLKAVELAERGFQL